MSLCRMKCVPEAIGLSCGQYRGKKMKFNGVLLPKDVILFCLVPQLDHVYDFMALRSTCKTLQHILAKVDEAKLKYGSFYKGERLLDLFVKTVRVSHADHRRACILNFDSLSTVTDNVIWNMFPNVERPHFYAFTTSNHMLVYDMLSDLNYNWANVQSYWIQFLPRRCEKNNLFIIRTIVKDEKRECSVMLNKEKVMQILVPKVKLKWRE